MAKQIGIFPLSGSLDNITFFRTPEGGYRVRKKTRLNSTLMATMPAFERTREHNTEFARAARAMKTIRTAIKGLLRNTADRKSALRLRHCLTDCLHADTGSIRGQRSPQNGDLSLLKNFDFNNRALLRTVFAAPFTTTIDRATGTLSLAIPAFNPKHLLTAPPQATHFRILMAGAAVDFPTEATESSTAETPFLPINTPAGAINLTVALTPATTAHLFIFLSIHFYEETNGQKHPIHTANPLTLVDVEQEATSKQLFNNLQAKPGEAVILPTEAQSNKAKPHDPLSPQYPTGSKNSTRMAIRANPQEIHYLRSLPKASAHCVLPVPPTQMDYGWTLSRQNNAFGAMPNSCSLSHAKSSVTLLRDSPPCSWQSQWLAG